MTKQNVHWQGKWIWLPGLGDTPNVYVFFRKTFRCNPGKKPVAALLHITAGHFYRVYINGEFIGRGPDRSYFRDKIFHSYDISRFLKKGENVIAVQVHFLGRSKQSVMERHAAGPSGLIAQIEVDGTVVAQTDGTWKTAQNMAYSMQTTPPMCHREWCEDFSASREPKHWQVFSFDDTSWKTAEVVAPSEGGPWTRLVPKETAEMTAELLAPITLYMEKPQYCYDEKPEYDETTIYNDITKKPHRWPGPLRVWNCKRQKHSLLFDMGRVVAGFPRLDISQCNGGKIEIYYGDTLSLTHWDTVNLGGEPLVWTPFTTRGGRYFRLDISGAPDGVSFASIRWVRTNYPVQKRGRFHASDPMLNAIWDICVRSAETCGMDHFVDCVGREQVLWMMDLRFQAPQHYYYFGDTALARKCIRQFAVLQFPNGCILQCGPSALAMEELSIYGNAFIFYYIFTVWEYYRFTGDRDFLKEFYPVCRRCLEYCRGNEQKGSAHAGTLPGAWVDWGYEGYVGNKGAVYSFTQAMYYGAQDTCRSICTELGKKKEAAEIAERMQQLQRNFFKLFVDPKSNKIADCVVGSRRMMKQTAHPYIAAARFLNNIPPRVLHVWLRAMSDRRFHASVTGFGNTLAAEAFMRHGRYAEAVRHISDYWGAMVEAGLPQTPESFDVRAPHYMPLAYSACHSYASMAGVLLQQIVLGGRVEGRLVTLSPYFGKLSSARGVVPTIGGDVHISWRRRGKMINLDVKAPKGITVRFEPVNAREHVTFRLKILK